MKHEKIIGFDRESNPDLWIAGSVCKQLHQYNLKSFSRSFIDNYTGT